MSVNMNIQVGHLKINMLMSGLVIIFLCATVFMTPWGVIYSHNNSNYQVQALIGTFWVGLYYPNHTEFKILADLLDDCPNPEFQALVCDEAPKYYIAGVILLIGFVFSIILEFMQFFRSINKLVNGGRWKWQGIVVSPFNPQCFLGYNFLITLTLSVFWVLFTGTLWNLFSVTQGGAPSWGFGMALIASLVLLLIGIHYSIYRQRLDNGRNINRLLNA